MIFQNFGFNRQESRAAVAPPAFNYVAGAKVIFDIGNSASYPGTGQSVFNIGTGGATNNGIINATGTYQSNNGGVLYLTNTGRKRIEFGTILTAAFTTQAFLRHVGTTTWGTGPSFYSGFPNIRGTNGLIVTNEVPNVRDVLPILWNGASAFVPGGNIITPADINIFHSYAYSSNGTNDHRMTLDTSAPAVATNSISRSNSATIVSYINYDVPNNGSTDMEFMGYLQYDRVLTAAEIAQNYAVFSSRF